MRSCAWNLLTPPVVPYQYPVKMCVGHEQRGRYMWWPSKRVHRYANDVGSAPLRILSKNTAKPLIWPWSNWADHFTMVSQQWFDDTEGSRAHKASMCCSCQQAGFYLDNEYPSAKSASWCKVHPVLCEVSPAVFKEDVKSVYRFGSGAVKDWAVRYLVLRRDGYDPPWQ